MAQPEKPIYRINEAAAALGISRPTIYRLMKRGELRLIKIGSTTSSGITAASIKAMIERSDMPAEEHAREPKRLV